MEYKTEIPKEYWSICKICEVPLEKMKKRSNQYLTQRFFEHLRDEHSMSFEEYLDQYEDVQTPMCPCECGERTGVNKKFSGRLVVNKYIRFHSTASDLKFKESVERSKITRRGSGNPMFGKTAWNSGLTKNDNETIAKMSNNRKGIQFSKETLKKMSDSAKKRLISGHTDCKHSEETKRIIAQKTIDAIKRGAFKHTKTKPHIAMSLILDEIGLLHDEEQSIEYWLFDFLILDHQLYVEVDGDYFHSNPLFYPNGPQTKTQKVNYYRDKKKDKFCNDNKVQIIRFWENDILKNREQVKIKIMEKINEITKNHKR